MVFKFDEVVFLEEAAEFLHNLDPKAAKKILYNIELAKFKNDSNLFKKLSDDIWEFRTINNRTYYRIFAFWDRRNRNNVFVIATHGLIKKTGKIDPLDIRKAKEMMRFYFESNN